MTPRQFTPGSHSLSTSVPNLGRREMLARTATLGATLFAGQKSIAAERATSQAPPQRRPSQRIFDMKKSINMWAFPYPDKWSLKECFELAKDAGFDGIEINFALDGEFSAESSGAQIDEVGKLAQKVGIAISGICSFLYWPFPLTHNDPARREQSVGLGLKMIDAARRVGTDNVLVVPGAVYAPWIADFEPVPNDLCDLRAREAVKRLIPAAEKAKVYLNMENIFANGFLFSPQEMVSFVDSFGSEHVKIHFDTGNIMEYQFPEHWVPILGNRIKNIHFKEWDKRTHEFNLHCFRTLLDGTTNWPAVIEALDKVGYRGYLTFEYFHPFNHYPEALIYQASESLDWILCRKA